MTYNVSSGTLNSTILYLSQLMKLEMLFTSLRHTSGMGILSRVLITSCMLVHVMLCYVALLLSAVVVHSHCPEQLNVSTLIPIPKGCNVIIIIKNECHSNIIVDRLQGCSHSKKLRESESESRSSKVV